MHANGRTRCLQAGCYEKLFRKTYYEPTSEEGEFVRHSRALHKLTLYLTAPHIQGGFKHWTLQYKIAVHNTNTDAWMQPSTWTIDTVFAGRSAFHLPAGKDASIPSNWCIYDKQTLSKTEGIEAYTYVEIVKVPGVVFSVTPDDRVSGDTAPPGAGGLNLAADARPNVAPAPKVLRY